jgi:formylglycine-generating enzyme required for sulfatase activity
MVAVPRPDGGTMCIDSTEVTRGQYKLFLESVVEGTAPQQPDYCQWNQVFEPLDSCLKQNDVCQPSQGDCDQHPVVCVDQCDAMAYCAWAGKRLCGGIKGGGVSYNNFDDVGSSQWMNACSSGETMSKPTNTYFGGTKVINCNRLGLMNCEPYGPNSVNICTTWAVGTHPGCQASAPYAGVFDLGGNVWEWEDSCQASSGETDPCRLRGGSYADSIESERCAADISAARNGYNSNVGFRCCGP